MTIAGRFEVKAVVVLGLAFSCFVAEAISRRGLIDAGPTDFNVNSYGAKADDKTNNEQAFMKAWVAACKSSGPAAKLVFPKGTYLTGPVTFAGPCTVSEITVEVQGTIKATTDVSDYSSPEWFSFESIDGLTLYGTGGGFNGQGEASWKYNDCHDNSQCQLLATSIYFRRLNNTIVHGITSLNSKSFHTHVVSCQNFTAYNLTITAPANSPNTDGMHISMSNLVNISNSVIATGDDCISIGQGNTNISITKITCGPGHGISIGSLGKYDDEKDVSGIVVTNCTLKNTTNGARIKTWPGSPPSKASSITFQDIIMDMVQNPIIIDQKYGSHKSAPSRVQISDVHFKNIVGTTTSKVAVTLSCSSQVPCQGVELFDIDLDYMGMSAVKDVVQFSNSCLNAKVKSGGKQNPPACH
uniref:Exopolygalacturonase-like n=1 Tax=Fagus sylvatica TaxID=28930 RepID=A0A2N9IAK8_FAGSY